MKNQVEDQILHKKIVAIIRGVKPDQMAATVEALYKGGIRLLEVTFDQENIRDTQKSLELIAKDYAGKVLMGAGTVLSLEQLDIAVKCGAEYIISPNTDINIIKKTRELGKVSVPGALTPTEVAAAYHAGASFVKVFPLGVMGVGYIKALQGPLGYVPFIAVGGVNIDNIQDFFDVGVAGVGIGGNLVNVKAVNSGHYYKITETARQYVERVGR